MPVNMVLTQQYAIDMLLNKAGKRSTTLLQLKAAVKHKMCFLTWSTLCTIKQHSVLRNQSIQLVTVHQANNDHWENNSPQPNYVSIG